MRFCKSVFLMVLLSVIVEGCSDPDSRPTPKPGSIPVDVVEEAAITDIDGNVYDIVQIGDQVWMSENLRTTRYRNGEEIPYARTDAAWENERVGMRCAYDHDEANSMTYGQLYNWYAVKDERGLCPSGWHVPSDDEWNALERTLGLSSVDAKQTGYRGVHGASMKSDAWNGTNESGFSGLPGGFRNDLGYFLSAGYGGYWWSSSPSGSNNAWFRDLYSNYVSVNRTNITQCKGLSVRCVRG